MLFFNKNINDIKQIERLLKNNSLNINPNDYKKILKLINELKIKMKYYKVSLYLDDLTNLLNQKFYNIFLNKDFEIKRQEEKELFKEFLQYIKANNMNCIMFIDFANFKYVNDIHGYDKGDLLLKMFGDFINLYNVIGIRRGGDEFIIIGNKEIIQYLASTMRTETFLKYFNQILGIKKIITFPVFSFKCLDLKKIDESNFKQKINTILVELEKEYKENKQKQKEEILKKYFNDNLVKKILSYRKNGF